MLKKKMSLVVIVIIIMMVGCAKEESLESVPTDVATAGTDSGVSKVEDTSEDSNDETEEVESADLMDPADDVDENWFQSEAAGVAFIVPEGWSVPSETWVRSGAMNRLDASDSEIVSPVAPTTAVSITFDPADDPPSDPTDRLWGDIELIEDNVPITVNGYDAVRSRGFGMEDGVEVFYDAYLIDVEGQPRNVTYSGVRDLYESEQENIEALLDSLQFSTVLPGFVQYARTPISNMLPITLGETETIDIPTEFQAETEIGETYIIYALDSTFLMLFDEDGTYLDGRDLMFENDAELLYWEATTESVLIDARSFSHEEFTPIHVGIVEVDESDSASEPQSLTVTDGDQFIIVSRNQSYDENASLHIDTSESGYETTYEYDEPTDSFIAKYHLTANIVDDTSDSIDSGPSGVGEYEIYASGEDGEPRPVDIITIVDTP